MFVCRNGKTVLDDNVNSETEGVPSVVTKDCLIYEAELQTGDVFINPGIIVQQKNGEIICRRPNEYTLFCFKSKLILSHFIMDRNRLFALDNNNNAHILYTNGTTPEKHLLQLPIIDWCVVPNTRMMITWNLLSMRVFDPDKLDITLKEHQSQVTAVTATAAVVVSGDTTGHLCIWYVSAWKCHHNIIVGDTPIEQIEIEEDQVYVRTVARVCSFDLDTGTPTFTLCTNAVCIHLTSVGLVIAKDSGEIEMYSDGVRILAVHYKTSHFIKSVNSRLWCVHDRLIQELDLNNSIIQWPTQCLLWIENPTFPFNKTWPTTRYMDVLAMSVDEWMPKIKEWDPPRQWFRHKRLRLAIWTWSSREKIGLSNAWMFLPPKILVDWYILCLEELKQNVVSFEYRETIVDTIEHIHRSIDISDTEILEWCWFHHDKLRMRQIIIRLAENDNRNALMQIITKNTPSADAVFCITTVAVRRWLQNGFIAVFILMLRAYHKTYPYGPTNETRSMFQLVAARLLVTLDPSTCDIPLDESGRWATKVRLMPDDVGKYVRTGTCKGFLRKVTPKMDGTRDIEWCPLHHSVQMKLTSKVEIWEYHHPTGPYTPLECSLNLLNGWTSTPKIIRWPWFQTEIGAFLAQTRRVTVFGEQMRIFSATWGVGGAVIQTSTGVTISDEENVRIEVRSSRWTYMSGSVHYIGPLKMKICKTVSLMTRNASIEFAKEILICCQSETIQHEQKWQTEQTITAMTSDMCILVVGFANGMIFEYRNMSTFKRPIRTFKGQTEPIQSLHILDSSMVSMSDDCICIWCLTSGRVMFSIKTELCFVAVVPMSHLQMWTIEHSHSHWNVATLWDIEDKIPLCKQQIPLSTGRAFYSFEINGIATLVTDSEIVLWSKGSVEDIIKLGVQNVSCVVPTSSGICGGTLDGALFLFDFVGKKRKQYATEKGNVVVAMAAIPNSEWMIVGDTIGQISLWDVHGKEVSLSVHISDEPVQIIHVQNMFAIVSFHSSVHLLSVVQDRASVSCQALYQIMLWSPRWKRRLLCSTKENIQPVVFSCIKQKKSITIALDLIDKCTENYVNRTLWCGEEVCDLLLELPLNASQRILKRLVSFRGPRIDCVICADSAKKDTVSFLPACHHRFHTGCIAEHIRKTPELHNEMQNEYALTVELKCPICRTKFGAEEVKLDNILNCT